MKRLARLISVLGSTMGVLFALAVLGGNTQPTCGASDPSEPVCLTSADCDGEPDVDCVGAWACIDATCAWQCTVTPAGCYSDWDCAKGTHCSVSDGVCNAPPDCPVCDVCYGACVDDVVEPTGCYSDGQCAEGQFCDTSVCLPPPGCTGDMACPAVCYGQCTDKPAGCTSDAQCGADQYCDFATCGWYGAAEDRAPCRPDASGAGCLVPPCEGVCLTRPVVTGCTSDADCGDGMICQVEQRCYATDCADGTDCGAPLPCEPVGVCVPATTGCWADDECPAGYQCNFYYGACGTYDDGTTDPDVPCQSRGVCEPIQGPECFSDADCQPGFRCEAMYKCDPSTNCDDAGNCGDEKCIDSPGVCVADTIGCSTDYDCPSDMVCQLWPCDCYAENGEDCWCEPYGECVPYQFSPCDAVKCAAGTHCEEVTVCYDGEDCVSPDGSLCDPMPGGCSTYAECVPDSAGCTADYECPAGYACELYPCDCANYDPATGVDCICEPFGQCVPVTQPDCTSDADCEAGYHCEFSSWCGCADGENCPMNEQAWCLESGVCVPDPAPLCLTNSDCAAGEICNALDVCILLDCSSPECSYCHGYCIAEQKACTSDYDCAPGQFCAIPPYLDENGVMACCPANSDIMCLMIYPTCEGVCVPAAAEICGNYYDDDGDGLVDEGCGTTTTCSSDADCMWYETCQAAPYFGADAAAPRACCPFGNECADYLPPCEAGVCVLQSGYCWSNADCPWGQVCEGAIGCPAGAYCLVAAGPGKCTPGYPTEEVCGNGMDDDGNGLVDEGCDNVCPDGTACAEGEVCKEEAVCPDCYNQDPPCLMPCMLQYVCEPINPPTCVVSGCSGQICAPEPMASTCEWLPWYACYQLAKCDAVNGVCGWVPNDEFKMCMIENGGF